MPDCPAISIHDDAAAERLRLESGLNLRPWRRLRYGFYQLGRPDEELLTELPLPARTEILAQLRLHDLQLVDRRTSAEGATKLILRTRDYRHVEAVILGAATRRRTSLCISSQVGCAARCVFCATGQMAQVRDLSAREIVDQVSHANQLLRGTARKVTNVVFMGMGEPFHNEEAVIEAARLLFSQRHFNLSPKRAVVSTVGVPAAMLRFARRFPHTSLALSLHAARQDVRERLIPLARRYPMDELRATLAEVLTVQKAPLMIEYLLLSGINDSLDDAHLLADFLRDFPVLVNLIPFNPVDHAPELTSSSREHGTAFASVLRDRGFLVTFRRSLGKDIEAACGQLIQQLDQGVVPVASP